MDPSPTTPPSTRPASRRNAVGLSAGPSRSSSSSRKRQQQQQQQQKALHGNVISDFGRAGNILTPDEIVTLRRKNGICVDCGITRTHHRSRRMFYLGLKAITDEHSYKGHCLRCKGGLARVKQSLGEKLTTEEAASIARSTRSMRQKRVQPKERKRADTNTCLNDSHQIEARNQDLGGTSTSMDDSHQNEAMSQDVGETGTSMVDLHQNKAMTQDVGNLQTEGEAGGGVDATNGLDFRPRVNLQAIDGDDDSTRAIFESTRRFHFVDTGALHLGASTSHSIRSYGRFIDSLGLDVGESQNAAIIEEEIRENREASHFLGGLNRTSSWDESVSVAVSHGTSYLSPPASESFVPERNSLTHGGEPADQDGGGDGDGDGDAKTQPLGHDGETTDQESGGDAKTQPAEAQTDENEIDQDVETLRNIATEDGLKGVISFTSSHRHSRAVLQYACSEIRTQAPRAQMSLAMQHESADGNAEHPPPPTLQRQKTLALANILPPHWIKVLISAMEDYTGDASILGELVQTIWVVASLHARFKTDVCDCGGVISVANAMRCHPNDTPLQLNGCGLFTCLLASDRHSSYLNDVGSVFERMLRLAVYTEPSVCEYALRALFLMHSTRDEAFRSKFRKAGVANAIIDAMNLHVMSPSVQERAIDLLFEMSADTDSCLLSSDAGGDSGNNDNNDGDENAAVVAISSNLINAISTAISNHGEDKMIQLAALGVLCNLCSTRMSELITQPIAKDLVETIVHEMKNSPATGMVQSFGCRAISNLLCCSSANNEYVTPHELKTMFTELDIIHIIVRAFEKPWLDNTLLADACNALTALCIDFPSNKDALLRAGGIAIGIDIIHVNAGLLSEKAMIVRAGASRMLATLAITSDGLEELNKPGVIDEILTTTIEAGGIGSPVSPIVLNLLAARCTNEDTTKRLAATSSAISQELQSSSCADEAERSISMLYVLSESEECVDTLLSSEGIVDRILGAMEMFPDSGGIQERACGVLSNVYLYYGIAEERNGISRHQKCLASEREIHAIIDAIRAHKFRSLLQEHAMMCLRNLLTIFSTRVSSSASATTILLDAVDGIVEAMKTNKHSIRVQENASGLLWALAELSSSLHLAVASAGGIQQVISVFVEFIDDEDMQSEALGCLAAFSSTPDIVSAVATREGIGVLLGCMETFKHEEEQVQRVCTLLSAISSDSHAARQEIIDRHDAIDLILSCMQLYSGSSVILKEAFALLANIAIDDFVQRIFNEGGLLQVESAIDSFPQELPLQREACELLCCLVHVIPGDEILESNVLSSVIQAASAHEEDEGIQVKCLEALWAIAAKGPSNKREVAFFGGVDIVIAAMKRHVTSCAIAEKGCVCLWSLAFDNETSILIGQWSDVIVNAMMANANSPQIQLEALGALKTLAASIENKDILQRGPALDSIVLTMWVHGENDKVQEAALMALTNIVVNPLTNDVLATSHNQLEAVISAARHFPESESVQEQACILLRNYTFKNSNIDLMRSSPLVFEALAGALERFPATCGERASYVIDCLYA